MVQFGRRSKSCRKIQKCFQQNVYKTKIFSGNKVSVLWKHRLYKWKQIPKWLFLLRFGFPFLFEIHARTTHKDKKPFNMTFSLWKLSLSSSKYSSRLWIPPIEKNWQEWIKYVVSWIRNISFPNWELGVNFNASILNLSCVCLCSFVCMLF